MIYLFRHGETQFNIQERMLSYTDLALLPTGESHFQAIASVLQTTAFSAIYSSGYQRAWQSAQIIARYRQMSVVRLPGLRERHLGELEGQYRKDVNWQKKINQLSDREFIPSGGESIAVALQRFEESINHIIKHKHGNVLIVSHGGIIALFMKYVLNVHDKNIFLQNGCCHLINTHQQELTVAGLNINFI